MQCGQIGTYENKEICGPVANNVVRIITATSKLSDMGKWGKPKCELSKVVV